MGNKIYKREIVELEGVGRIIFEWKDVRSLRLRYRERYRMFSLSVPAFVSKERAIDFVLANRAWIEVTRRRVESSLRLTAELTPTQLYAFQTGIRRIVAECERLMGLHAAGYTLRAMTSRWGSANPRTRQITLNSRLAHFPEECWRYVVVHELSHFVHPNHSRAFWSYVAKYCPDYERIKGILNG